MQFRHMIQMYTTKIFYTNLIMRASVVYVGPDTYIMIVHVLKVIFIYFWNISWAFKKKEK